MGELFFQGKKVSVSIGNEPNLIPKNKKSSWEIDHRLKDDIDPPVLYHVRLGSGGQGGVYQLCDKKKEKCGVVGKEYIKCKKCDYILKIYHTYSLDEIKLENIKKIYKACSDAGLSSPLIDSWNVITYNEKSLAIVTKRFDVNLKDYLNNENITMVDQFCAICKALLIINKMHGLGIIHGDPHAENFMFDKTKKLYVIDLDMGKLVDHANMLILLLKDYKIFQFNLKFTSFFTSKENKRVNVFFYREQIKKELLEKIINPLEIFLKGGCSIEKYIEYETDIIKNFIKDIPIPLKYLYLVDSI